MKVVWTLSGGSMGSLPNFQSQPIRLKVCCSQVFTVVVVLLCPRAQL